MSKTWTGKFVEMMTVRFGAPQRKWSSGFSGTATIYRFIADDPKCKVIYAALVRGVAKGTMCSESGAVGQAILMASGLKNQAKNGTITSSYDTFPEPIGCGAKRLQNDDLTDPVYVLDFFRKV